MNKTLVVISCAINTFSGYGAKSRGWVRSLIELKGEEWDIRILPQRWGSTTEGFIEEYAEEWGFLKNHFVTGPLPKKPDIYIVDSVASEFQPHGEFNIGFCSGIETTVCDASWIEGCNRMDLIITSSEHSKSVFENSVFEKKQGDQIIEVIKLNKPCKVLFEGLDLNLYKKIKKGEFTNTELYDSINSISEHKAFLTVGHWLQGDLGEDRKNIGLTIKAFYEIWKDKPNKPALIMKINGANTSYLDKADIQKKIENIKNTVNSKDLPNIYVIHGEFSDVEINEIYNHPKIKSMISITKGEGFGRPLLEFSMIGKPIIASGWSGHVDFLNKNFTTLLNGQLKPIHKSAQVPNTLIEGSHWFEINHGELGMHISSIFNNYDPYIKKAKQQAQYSRSKFSKEKMRDLLEIIFEENVPKKPKFKPLTLPKKKLKMPSLSK